MMRFHPETVLQRECCWLWGTWLERHGTSRQLTGCSKAYCQQPNATLQAPVHYWKPVKVGNTASKPSSYEAAVTNYTAGRQRQPSPITRQDKCFRSTQTSRTCRACWQPVSREIAPWLTSARASAAAHQSNPFPNCNVNLEYPLHLCRLNSVPWQTSLNLIHQTSLQMSLCQAIFLLLAAQFLSPL